MSVVKQYSGHIHISMSATSYTNLTYGVMHSWTFSLYYPGSNYTLMRREGGHHYYYYPHIYNSAIKLADQRTNTHAHTHF